MIGDPSELKSPNTVVLDKTHAIKYFGDWKMAMGQFLKLDNQTTLKIVGILEDQPENSDFPMKIGVSFITLIHNSDPNGSFYGFAKDAWGADLFNHQIYCLVQDPNNLKQISLSLKSYVKKYYGDLERMLNVKKTLFLQPLKDIHFDKRFGNFGDHTTSITILWTLSLIGIFILFMASINFINLSTAYALKRSKEVGIRKILGINRISLIIQILLETGLIVLFSEIISLVLIQILLPHLTQISGLPVQSSVFNAGSLIFMGSSILIITLLSGIYPALSVASFKPISALKNPSIHIRSKTGVSLRSVLVVLQFSISQVMVIGVLVAMIQMNKIRNADLGFNKEAVLIIPNESDATKSPKAIALKNELKSLPGVKEVSYMFDAPCSDNNWEQDFHFNHLEKSIGFNLYLKQGDADYFKTFGLKFIAGHPYQNSDTTREIVVNETLVHKLGIRDPQDILGKEIRFSDKWFPIVGVVKDFKSNSQREGIKPIALFASKNQCSKIGIKLYSNNLSGTLNSIQKIWENSFPDFVYQSSFLDENIANFYRQENQLETLLKIFAGIGILISCLGLYGLVSFMTLQKTKEVGIRKVLGASSLSIINLFSKEFTILILLSFVISAPIGYFFMHHWLLSFAFRITIGWEMYLSVLTISLILAWLTVGIKSFRTAIENPIKSLRTE